MKIFYITGPLSTIELSKARIDNRKKKQKGENDFYEVFEEKAKKSAIAPKQEDTEANTMEQISYSELRTNEIGGDSLAEVVD